METVSRIHQNRGFFSAFTLLALYGLLIFLVISFSGQILEDFSSAGGSEERNFILLTTLLLSVVILVIMVLQFIRLVKDQREGKPGARIKGRFVRYFILIGVLSSLPQGILATHFIDRVFNSILGANLGQSLEGGINIALNFYRERKDDLRALGNSTILQDLLEEDIPRNPENLAQKLVEISPALSFLQVFSPQGEMILSQGNDLGQVRYSNIENYPAGPLLPITRGDITVERYFSRVPGTRGEYSVVLGTNLPQGFEDQTELIQMARRVYVQMLTFQERFRFSLIFFYLIFALPILLLSIFLSFLLTDRLLRPLVNLESATRSVAEGDFTTRILAPSQRRPLQPGDLLQLHGGRAPELPVQESSRPRKSPPGRRSPSAWPTKSATLSPPSSFQCRAHPPPIPIQPRGFGTRHRESRGGHHQRGQ
jgi:two-component system nitrogen regulation sensor histidine kinase NtrY